jgi:hypothetical protein
MVMRLFQSLREKRQDVEDARSIYNEFVRNAAASDPVEAHRLAAEFKENPQLDVLSEKERRERSSTAFRVYAENVLAADRLTEEEERAFGDVADAFDVDETEFATTFSDVLNRLVIARVNDGRLGVIGEPQLMTKKDEIAHLETHANLMKEVAVREWRGASSGYSFRIAKGVTYRTGAIRGKSVVVGSELKVADSGLLAVTSHRIAYMGNKTIEMKYDKLMNMDVFSDGVRVHVSNRQNAPLFKVDPGVGEVIAATVNAAMQKLE